jgi:V/A-type H+-transporting ATPase subunit I
MIRPRPARWFELLVARDDTTRALEALAATGAVELEARTAALPPSLTELRPLMQQYNELAQRYRAYWPREGLRASSFPEPPLAALKRCIEALRVWAVEAEPLIRRCQQGQAERAELERWRQVLGSLRDGLLDTDTVPGAPLQSRLFAFAADNPPELSGSALVHTITGETESYALAVGTAAQLQALSQQVLAAKGQAHELPHWLAADRASNLAELERRMASSLAQDAADQAALAALIERHHLRQALGDAERLHWVLDNVHALEAGELMCWITGWTSTPIGQVLEQAVERSGVRALLRFAPPPSGATPPLLLQNPWWARPFEVFIRALGMPSGAEADASVLLALAVPLMFGYMFGDLGQGLVIAAAGLLLRRRWPLARLFIAGGLSAAVFGLLFGSVFSLHLWPAWWLSPLDDPLAVLLVPLAGGAALLSIGLALSAVQAYWRDALGRWLATDAGLVVSYLGLLVAVFEPRTLLAAAAGALWFCVGHAGIERRAGAAAVALAELIERGLQLLINTLSFARVGAFALAHAGLSSAIVALMHATDHAASAAVVLVIGNVVVLVLEGLVVSIQTTRLVLFEFFTRFLQGQGRVFRALALPPKSTQEIEMKPSTKFGAAVVAVGLVLAAAGLLVTTPLAWAAAAAGSAAVAGDAAGWGLAAAAVSTALAALGAGFAVGKVGTAAIGALAEKPELFGRLLIFVGLAEGIAIYGLIVSILILNRLT